MKKEDPIDNKFDLIDEICEAATEGPWIHFSYEKDGVPKADVLAAGRPGTILKDGSVGDARFVAVARSAVPWLMDKCDVFQLALIRMCLEKYDGDIEKAYAEFAAMTHWAADPESVDSEKIDWVGDCLRKG
jgi:hypothetical protein